MLSQKNVNGLDNYQQLKYNLSSSALDLTNLSVYTYNLSTNTNTRIVNLSSSVDNLSVIKQKNISQFGFTEIAGNNFVMYDKIRFPTPDATNYAISTNTFGSTKLNAPGTGGGIIELQVGGTKRMAISSTSISLGLPLLGTSASFSSSLTLPDTGKLIFQTGGTLSAINTTVTNSISITNFSLLSLSNATTSEIARLDTSIANKQTNIDNLQNYTYTNVSRLDGRVDSKQDNIDALTTRVTSLEINSIVSGVAQLAVGILDASTGIYTEALEATGQAILRGVTCTNLVASSALQGASAILSEGADMLGNTMLMSAYNNGFYSALATDEAFSAGSTTLTNNFVASSATNTTIALV